MGRRLSDHGLARRCKPSDRAAAIIRIACPRKQAPFHQIFEDSSDARRVQKSLFGQSEGLKWAYISQDPQHPPLRFGDTCPTQGGADRGHDRLTGRQQPACE